MVIPGITVIGQDGLGHNSSPTVTAITGASLGTVVVHNSSIFLFKDGVAGSLLPGENSFLSITGGHITSSVNPAENSVVNMSGGSIDTFLTLSQQSLVNVSGGSVLSGIGHGGTLNMSGAASVVSLSLNSSHVNISGGNINSADFFTSSSGSVATITGGNIALLRAKSTLTDISGGTGGDIIAFGGTTLNFYGMGLGDTLVDSMSSGPPNFTLVGDTFSKYALFGNLQSGSSLNGRFLYIPNRETVSTNFINAVVPEPGSLALLAGLSVTGSVFMVSRFRRRKYMRHRLRLHKNHYASSHPAVPLY